jgi:hypothetical protein
VQPIGSDPRPQEQRDEEGRPRRRLPRAPATPAARELVIRDGHEPGGCAPACLVEEPPVRRVDAGETTHGPALGASGTHGPGSRAIAHRP